MKNAYAHFNDTIGGIKPMHGTNNGPVMELIQKEDIADALTLAMPRHASALIKFL